MQPTQAKNLLTCQHQKALCSRQTCEKVMCRATCHVWMGRGLTEEDLLGEAQAVLEVGGPHGRQGSRFRNLVGVRPQLAAQQRRQPVVRDGRKAVVLQAVAHILQRQRFRASQPSSPAPTGQAA